MPVSAENEEQQSYDGILPEIAESNRIYHIIVEAFSKLTGFFKSLSRYIFTF